MLKKIKVALLKRWGTLSEKQSIWDSEYDAGKWTYSKILPNNEATEPIYRFLEMFSSGGSILDLGCGSGMTALEMTNNFAEYVGVDVSQVAVEKARLALCNEPTRRRKVSFTVADIATYQPSARYKVILFRESIYYVPQCQIKDMLRRYSTHLLPNGVFIVRLCDRYKYEYIAKLLMSRFGGQQVFVADDSAMSIFVCSAHKP